MRNRAALFLPTLSTLSTIAVSLSLSTLAGGADQAPKRVRRDCPTMRADIERISKNLKTPLKITPGSWGDLPAPLRKLPAGAELCGVGSLGQAIIVSPAYGKELETHYAPLFAELDCKPLKCTVGANTNCGCSGPGGGGTVLTDTAAESYTVMYMQLKKKK